VLATAVVVVTVLVGARVLVVVGVVFVTTVGEVVIIVVPEVPVKARVWVVVVAVFVPTVGAPPPLPLSAPPGPLSPAPCRASSASSGLRASCLAPSSLRILRKVGVIARSVNTTAAPSKACIRSCGR